MMRNVQLSVRPLARKAESSLLRPLARRVKSSLLRLLASRMESRSPRKDLSKLVADVKRPRDD
jgi:hypothetical protein